MTDNEEITEFFAETNHESYHRDAELRMALLVENSSCSEAVIPEHGLSVYIEYNGMKGLYDTGQSDRLISNAEEMHIDLKDLDWISLSHGHYDHTGGLKSILSFTETNIPVYAGKSAFKQKYARRDNGVIEEIGVPFKISEISELAQSVNEVGDIQEIYENVYLIGPAPLNEDYEGPSRYMLIKDTEDNYINDMMEDERTLVIRTSKGLVIITGCAHRGSVNITKDIIRRFPEENILMILGGFHLGKTDDDSVQKRIDAFKKLEIEAIGLCHCTGAKASKSFKEQLRQKCFIAPAGSEIII